MNKSNIRKSFMSIFLFIFLFILTAFNFISISQAAPNGDSLDINIHSFQMEETSKIKGKIENTTSININLPTSNWNASHIELNFTNIKIERELKTIEDNWITPTNLYYLTPSTNQLALYVQLEIPEETTVFGVYIFGQNFSNIENATFQIRNYDTNTFEPKDFIWGSTPLNMSDELDWYLQDFSSNPVTLPIGNYCLVINATENYYPNQNGPIVSWYHNGGTPPHTPNLHIGEYYSLPNDHWIPHDENKTFLHKVIQKVNESINPEEINMQVNLGGTSYEITDHGGLGGGNLSTSCNCIIYGNILEIQISNNQSITLNYTVEYVISLQKISNPETSLLVKELTNNRWTVEFTVNKYNFSYVQVEINYSRLDWNDITILKSTEDFTTQTLNDTDKSIILSNDTIDEGLTDWTITAYSPQIEFNLNFPAILNTIEPGQELKFSVDSPRGNLTFILIDSTGLEDYSDDIEHLSEEDYIFDYTIPNNAHSGDWKIYTYWNNNSHAGVISQEFSVFVPFTIDPQVIINALITIAIISIVGISSYQTLKYTKKYYDDKKARLLHTVSDILNLKYFMITEKNTGLNIYDKKIGKGRKDAMLISGYLDAISKFEIALTSSEKRSQSIKLEYQKSKILMSEFKNFRIILIMKKNPSKFILESIEKLSYDIEREYGEYLSNFSGDLRNFKGLDQVIENYLHISLVYPFKINYKKIDELTKRERLMIQRATNIMQTSPHFYILFLIPENQWKYRNFKTILKLIEKKVFYPERIIKDTLE